jgi:DNA polymerase-3 subunit epsilon
MREIALDTETTGLSHRDGHRIIEIGCVELINRIPTGKVYHQYINPERDVSPGATEISGLTYDFLKDYPSFQTVANDFYQFISGATLVIHNASFDIGFINSEFLRVDLPLLNAQEAIDTVALSRKKFPGQPANLDAICKRFNIDNSRRVKHGALVDAELLAEIYIELLGGRQNELFKEEPTLSNIVHIEKPFRAPRHFAVNENELNEHQEFLKEIKDPLWLKISG